MAFETKISIRRERNEAFESMMSGIGSINIDQSMRVSKRRILGGSIAEDWRAIGRDIAKAIATVKSEKDAG